jgi:hypothetical protein
MDVILSIRRLCGSLTDCTLTVQNTSLGIEDITHDEFEWAWLCGKQLIVLGDLQRHLIDL